jgi:hypothetical protein
MISTQNVIAHTEQDGCLVSVLIPVYNRLLFLRHAIRSVLDQTHPSVEILIVDDGSPLDPGPVVDEFGDQVKLLRKINGGQASARNYGMTVARGEFILFLDDDDFLEANALRILLQALLCDPRNVWAAGRFNYVNEEGQRLPLDHPYRYESGDIYPEMIFNNLIGAPNVVLARTDKIRALGGFDEERAYQLAEDYDLWLSLAKDFPVVAVKEVVANYRLYLGQGTQNWARHHEAILCMLHKQRAGARPSCLTLFDQSIAQLHLRYGDDLYVHGQHAKARQHWRRSMNEENGISRWRLLQRFLKSYLPYPLTRIIRPGVGWCHTMVRSRKLVVLQGRIFG